jgi:transcriptional regulator with XRE-family HTH domain
MTHRTNFIDKQVGSRARVYRVAARLSEEEAASMIECSLQEYRQLEAGEVRFQAHQLRILSKNFGVLPSDFFERIEVAQASTRHVFYVAPGIEGRH